MIVQELMKQYNDILPRFNRACSYMDDNSVSVEDREKRIPDFQKILKKIYGIFDGLREQGYDVSPEEVREGFREVR